MVGDAFRVHALCDADYFFRHCQRLFLDHLKIAYHIDRGLRGNEGELVESAKNVEFLKFKEDWKR